MSKIKFTFLTGDVSFLDYGGKWISQKFNNGEFDFWFVAELINWENSVGEREAKEIGKKYCLSVAVVAPEQFQEKDRAMSNVGAGDKWDALDDRQKVECVHLYSGGAKVFSENGDNFKKLFAQARKVALEKEFFFGSAMDRAQNKIGSTGWDFLKGDVTAGLRRYDEDDSPEKQLARTISGLLVK